MLKSELEIEPYTISEALVCINNELKSIKRNRIELGHFNNLVYNKVKISTVKVKGRPVTVQYNSIVDIFNYVTTKRYPADRKSRCK